MKREDFKIVPRYYATSSLTMIFYNDIIIESVEIFKNYSAFEDAATKAERLASIEKQNKANEKLIAAGKPAKPIRVKSPVMVCKKDKRTETEISNECEKLIKKYIETHSLENA